MLRLKKRQTVTRITATPMNCEENLKCESVLHSIRHYLTTARFSQFADSDKRSSGPLSTVVLEGGCDEINQHIYARD